MGAFVGECLWERDTWGTPRALGASPAGAGAPGWPEDAKRTHQSHDPGFVLQVRPLPDEVLSYLCPDVFPAHLKMCQKPLPHLPFPKLGLLRICL